MSALYRRLGENLPERRPGGKDAFDTDPRALKQWIAALPLANMAVTARQLYHALRAINQQKLDPGQRLAALELLRRPVMQVAETVDRQIIGSTFPLPPQKAQLGTIARDFQLELSVGYRVAAVELCAPEGKVPFLRGKYVALALERAISHLGALLSKGYLLYATPPPGVWRLLHDAFRFAAEVRVDDKPIEDAELGGAEVTARASYGHALLLALSNPYRLTQKEIHETFLVTRVWAQLCALVETPSGPHPCAIPVDEDKGPGYLPEERDAPTGATIYFDASGLERELERQLNLVAGIGGPLSFRLKNSAAVAIGADLVRRLMANWQPPPDRAHPRLPAGHALDTLVGLHAIHYHLAGLVDFETFVRRACGPAIHMTERDRIATWATQAADTTHPDTYRARVLDQSLGGYRIEWEQGESARARVGEVVAVTPAADNEEDRDWMVGIIRWMRMDAAGKVDAGIELLARQARAAVLRALDSQGHPKPPVRAIRLDPSRRMNGHPFSVVAPSVLERGALRYELSTAPERYTDDEDPEVDMLPGITVVEQSGTYIRFAPREPAPATGSTDAPAATG